MTKKTKPSVSTVFFPFTLYPENYTHSRLASRYNGDSFVVTMWHNDTSTSEWRTNTGLQYESFQTFQINLNFMSIFLAEMFLPKRLTKKAFCVAGSTYKQAHTECVVTERSTCFGRSETPSCTTLPLTLVYLFIQ